MRCPFAEWRPVGNFGGNLNQPLGFVVHHTVGSLDSAESRFNDPSSGASAHFGIGKDGSIRQWVDTGRVAWHACQANGRWFGVEHETSAVDVWEPLNGAQIASSGRLLAWLHQEHGIPLRVTDSASEGGVAYHSMVPGACSRAWGLTGCPGDAIVQQRYSIVDAALGEDVLTKDEHDWLLAVFKAVVGDGDPTIYYDTKYLRSELLSRGHYWDALEDAVGGTSAQGGLTAEQVRAIVRDELDKTRLGH